MTILADCRLNVEPIECEPTTLDRLHAAMTSPFACEAHAVDSPTPDEALEDTTDHDDEDLGPWWAWMGPDEDLDARWGLTLAGGAGSRPTARATSTRVDAAEEARLYGYGR